MVETVVTVERTQTTQATGTTPSGGGLSAITINIGYYKTLPGILKIAQFILAIICLICASPAMIAATDFFLFAVVVGFIGTIIWIFVYLLGIREALNVAINWITTELVNTAIVTLLYFIGFIVQLATWSAHWNARGYGANIAGGVFGLFNFLAYAAGTYLLFLEMRSGATR